ncbi:MAG: amidohydrolase family protein [Gemmatimonadota bacterium]
MKSRTRHVLFLAVAIASGVAVAAVDGAPRLAPAAHPSALPSPADTGVQAFVGARIFDGTGGPVIDNGAVLVRDGVIAAVGPRDDVEIPAEAWVFDLTGLWLLPGLVNAHGHVSGDREAILEQLRQYAYFGVTTVVSLGGNEAAGFPLREEQASPTLDRARVFLAGPVLSPGSPAEARTEVARVAEMGADWVKIRVDGGLQGGAKMSPEVYGAVISEATARGLPVAIHIWELEDAKGVVRAGGSLVAHSVRDGRVDAELISLLRERDVCLVPTFTRELSTFTYAERPAFFADPFFLAGAAPPDLDAFLTPTLMQQQREGAAAAFWRQALPVAQENMRLLHEGGVGIAMGTDSGAPTGRWEGYFEHVELEMMVQGGISPEAALLAATGVGAGCMGLAGEVGTIAPGAWADFLVLGEDPRADILNTRQIHSVWISGNRVR